MDPYRPVLTKRDFVGRYARGEFGNGSPTWLTLKEFIDDSLAGMGTPLGDDLYHLRNGAVAGGETYYKQPWELIMARWGALPNGHDWYCSTQVPLDVERTLLVQGEVQIAVPGGGGCGLELFYSTVAKPMREALSTRAHQVQGTMASLILREYLCPNSLDWLYELLYRYPHHVVEFSAFSRRWGTLPNFNTLFWEVRQY